LRDWERIYRERGDLRFKVLPIVARASKLFRERKYERILDLACGTGKHSIYLAKKGFLVCATDSSLTGLKIAREKAASLGVDNISFQQHDMRGIPFCDGFFDAVICTWAIYHGTIAQIQQTIDEIYRVLRFNGVVITDFLSVDTQSYGQGREIEKGTFIGEKYNEEDVPLHYSNREDIPAFFREFRQVSIRLSTRYYTSERGAKNFSKRYYVTAIT
jgi:ubiquinone/menaquinone biosynthesis C-methylase UbiE